MSELLDITWYYQAPIDLEHKQYVLLAYLQKVDSNFLDKKLSPHLMHMQKLIHELSKFDHSLASFRKALERNKYIYFEDHSLDMIEISDLSTIKQIIEFSTPQLKSRIDLGYNILIKNKQILY